MAQPRTDALPASLESYHEVFTQEQCPGSGLQPWVHCSQGPTLALAVTPLWRNKAEFHSLTDLGAGSLPRPASREQPGAVRGGAAARP